jgi:hypothetical protein
MKNVNFQNSTALAATPTTPRPEGALVLVGVHSNPDHAFGYVLIKADVMFDYSNSVQPLFGRSGIRALQDIGLDPTDWHWNK